MSAFIVSRECMQRAVQTIAAHHKITRPDDLNRLGETLFSLNANAVNQRYAESIAANRIETAAAEVFEYSHDPDCTPAIGLKAIRCLLYQCAEGTVPDTGLFKVLDATAAALAKATFLVQGCQIKVGESFQYERAPWG